jgi:hypothetical protein
MLPAPTAAELEPVLGLNHAHDRPTFGFVTPFA